MFTIFNLQEYPTPNEANQLRGKTSQNTDKNDLPTSSDDLDIQNEPDAFDNNNTMNSVDQFDLADQTNNNTNDSQDANKMPDLSYVVSFLMFLLFILYFYVFPEHLKSFAPLFKEANKLTPETFNIILRFLGGNRGRT